jgi:hypothetical protein
MAHGGGGRTARSIASVPWRGRCVSSGRSPRARVLVLRRGEEHVRTGRRDLPRQQGRQNRPSDDDGIGARWTLVVVQ